MKITVKFLINHSGYNAGEVAGFNPVKAEGMIDAGVAMLFSKEEAQAEAEARQKKADRDAEDAQRKLKATADRIKAKAKAKQKGLTPPRTSA